MSEKLKTNIGMFFVSCILLIYGFICGYVIRMSEEIDSTWKEIERTGKQIIKIRKDGFFVDDFE